MTANDNLSNDVTAAKADLTCIKNMLSELDPVKSEPEGAQATQVTAAPVGGSTRITQLCARLEHLLSGPVSGEKGHSAALHLVMLVNELAGRIDELNPSSQDDQNAAQLAARFTTTFGGRFNKLKNKLVSLAAVIWQIVAHLTTVKEWKLHGDLSTGVLGLASAGIEITFG